jgi:hypothetical protein
MSKKNPVNAKQFTYEILISKGIGKLTRKAENMIVILGEGAIRKKEYYYEEDRKDCLQTSYLNMLTNWYNFNPDKTTNAFAYFTEIHKRSTAEEMTRLYMKKGLKKEEQKNVKLLSMNSTNNGQGLYNV